MSTLSMYPSLRCFFKGGSCVEITSAIYSHKNSSSIYTHQSLEHITYCIVRGRWNTLSLPVTELPMPLALITQRLKPHLIYLQLLGHKACLRQQFHTGFLRSVAPVEHTLYKFGVAAIHLSPRLDHVPGSDS